MGKVIRLGLSDNHLVLDELNDKIDDVAEMCVIYITKGGTLRIVHGGVDDNLKWYGILMGFAHNMFLHNFGDPIKDE